MMLWSWILLSLLSQVAVAQRERVLFLSGVPRSGTSLFTRFVQLHDEVKLLTNTAKTDTLEFLAAHAKNYGGSKKCLADMAAYAKRRAKHDSARHDVRHYLPQGEASAQMVAFKDPGNILSIAEQQASCEKHDVDCWFLVVWTSPFQWEAEGFRHVPCDPQDRCRADVVKHWVDIHQRALADLGNATVRAVSLDSAAHTATFAAIEAWLGLGAVPVRVLPRNRRNLVLHGNDLQDPAHGHRAELVVEEEHLLHHCPSRNHTTPDDVADVLKRLESIDVREDPRARTLARRRPRILSASPGDAPYSSS